MSGSAVLVPLYVYPFEGAWQPLYDALAAHPRTQFLVVVNPGNGPGPASLPDANYCREIPKLRSHSNAVVFGYVHVQWAQRSLDAVLQDVETYAAWPSQPSQTAPLRVDGIFVDETPTAADARTLDFLGSLTSRVHRLWSASPTHATSGDTPAVATPVAAGTARTPTIIHNPGCMPAAALLQLSDLCVVFEDTWTVLLQRIADGIFDPVDGPLPTEEAVIHEEAESGLSPSAAAGDGDRGATRAQNNDEQEAPGQNNARHHDGGAPSDGYADHQQQQLNQQVVLPDRSKRAVVVHSVPLPGEEGVGPAGQDGSVRKAKIAEVIEAASKVAGTVFVTELCEGYYERFGKGWMEWAGVIGGEE